MKVHPILRLLRLRLVRGGILLALIVLGVGVVRSVYSLSLKKSFVHDRQAVLLELEKEHARLQGELKEATSPAFIERAARDKLGLVKEGEKIVIMGRTRESELNDQNDAAQSNWEQWWNLFF